MGYSVYNFKGGRHHAESEADEFFEAAEKARKAVEKMHDLACEMEDRYSERYYGERYDRRADRYDRRDHEMWDDDMYGDRRRRDSRGRYM
jgi:hypothetical protein